MIVAVSKNFERLWLSSFSCCHEPSFFSICRDARKTDVADTTSRHVGASTKKGARKARSSDDLASQKNEDQLRDEAAKNRKTLKPRSRKHGCTGQHHEVQPKRISDQVEVSGGEPTISTKKAKKTKSRSKNKGDPKQSSLSSSPADGEGLEPVDNCNDGKRKKEAVKSCLGSEHAYISVRTSPLSSLNAIPEKIEIDDIPEALGVENNDDTRSLRCSTPDISDTWNSNISTVAGRNKLNGPKSKGKTRLNKTSCIAYRDDSTLASFIKKLKRSQKYVSSSIRASVLTECGKSTETSDNNENIASRPRCSSDIELIEKSSAPVVGMHERAKRLQTTSKSSSDQMFGTEYEDDATLASYCSRLKKRKL